MFYTYVISNTNGKIYIGQTANLEKRLSRHNHQLPVKKSSYTYKNKGMWKLVHKEGYNTRSEALTREKQLKSYQGRIFIRKLLGR